jgi:hypothetical protein
MIQIPLGELERQHRHLEEEITQAARHSSIDDLILMGLKREKLRIKDQIEHLRHQSSVASH